jgi:CRP-like cAMP-binding protein
MRIDAVPAGTVLVREGDLAHFFYVLVSGSALVEQRGRPVSVLGPGAIFGEVALLTYQRRTATVTATTDSQVLVVPERTFRQLVDGDRSFARRVYAAATSRA